MAGDAADMKFLTSKFTPYGQRVAIALREKKIPFEQIDVDVYNKPQMLLEANPVYRKIPTIIHNGKPVPESLVILQYLEDAFPGQVPLMPTDAFEKSKVRFWIDFVDKLLSAALAVFRTKPGTPEKQAACDEAVKNLKTLEAGMVSLSAKGPYFTGEKFGLVDVVLAPHCNTLPVLQEIGGLVVPGPDELPRLHQWFEDARAHPSVSSSLPSAAETVAYFKEAMVKRAAATAAALAAHK